MISGGKRRQIRRENLADVGLAKLVEAIHSGRLVAAVGSMATEPRGYGSWDEVLELYLKKLNKYSHPDSEIDGSNSEVKDSKKYDKDNPDKLHLAKELLQKRDDLSLDILETLFNVTRDIKKSRYKQARVDFAKKFGPKVDKTFPENKNACMALFRDLRVRRVITLNYDMELELAATQLIFGGERGSAIEKWELPSMDEATSPARGRTRLQSPDGFTILSQTVDRVRADALTNFALGVPDRQISILHLHGRYDDPDSMIVSRRDYRELYWRSGAAKPLVREGLKTIFVGNPVLFVGIGMSESDVMSSLEQFTSDNPFDVEFPRFLLWNSRGVAVEDMAFRLRMFHKFGVYVVFDTELVQAVGKSLSEYSLSSPGKFQRLTASITNLARCAEEQKSYEFDAWEKLSFCTARHKFRNEGVPNQGVQLWEAQDTYPESEFTLGSATEDGEPGLNIHEEVIKRLANQKRPFTVLVGAPGNGKGALARALFGELQKAKDIRPVLVNAAFAMDTDGILSQLTSLTSKDSAFCRGISRRAAFSGILNSTIDKPDAGVRHVIINGIGRFLDEKGIPLSLELDHLLRDVALRSKAKDVQSNIHFVLIGTNRVAAYAKTLGVKDEAVYNISICRDDKQDGVAHRLVLRPLSTRSDEPKLHLDIKGDGETTPEVQANYLFSIISAALCKLDDPLNPLLKQVSGDLKSLQAEAKQGLTRGIRGRALTLILNANTLDHLMGGEKLGKLAYSLLKTMAVIGQPLDERVLRYAPEVRKALEKAPKKKTRVVTGDDSAERVELALSYLSELKLVLKLKGFEDGSTTRYALHKSVVAELRERYGIPVSDARLANCFNLTLYSAQPIGTYAPRLDSHGELHQLSGHIVHLHKDLRKHVKAGTWDAVGLEAEDAEAIRESLAHKSLGEIEKDFRKAGLNFPHPARESSEDKSDFILSLLTPVSAAGMRAGYALLRNYYSVSSLLMQGSTDHDETVSLKDLARRLRDLLSCAQRYSIARREVAGDDEKMNKALGTPPFLPDDIMWIYNEIGVIELVLGRLYKAERALEGASHINANYIEFGERGPNWRRIQLNRVQMLLERGRLKPFGSEITGLRNALARHFEAYAGSGAQLSGSQGVDGSSAADMDKMMADLRAGKGRSRQFNRDYPHDLVLDATLVMGYTGILNTLKGEYSKAQRILSDTVDVLSRISERRAYAIFLRHLASVQRRSAKSETDAQTSLDLSIAACGGIRQGDIDNHARADAIMLQTLNSRPPNDAIPQLQASLAYAQANNMYRLQMEVLAKLAMVHRANRDFASAFRDDTAAMAIAARFGHGLSKVNLRLLLAQDYLLVGQDPDFNWAAKRLIDRVRRIGTKIGYTTCVERAENLRIEMTRQGLPSA